MILERGPDHRVVEWYSEIRDDSGTPLTLTNRYTEVATGLHFLDARGEWQDTVASFEAVPNGWVAARGPHQVALSTDISVPGSVTVVTSDGVTLRNTPTLLAYVDRTTGQEVRLADLQSSRGELIAPGTVLYANAFDSVSADVRAVYTPAGFECDVIVRAALPSPAEFGLNPDTTDLAVFTEFFETQPTDVKQFEIPLSERESSADTLLGFGSMRMDRGKAFVLPGDAGRQLRVRKSWEQREGRSFLLERTDWRELEPWIRELPEAGTKSPDALWRRERSRRTAGLEIPIRTGMRPEWPRSTGGRLLAGTGNGRVGDIAQRSRSEERGVVLDYSVVNTTANMTFVGSTTYLVSGAVTLGGSGNTVVFQGGTVVKYAKNAGANLKILPGTKVDWFGAPYRPVVLTAYDDNSAGTLLPNATGSPQGIYATTALDLDGTGRTSPLVLTNLSVRHAGIGLAATYFSAPSLILTVRHSQFIHCDGAFKFQLGSTVNNSFRVENALVYSTNSGSAVWRDHYYAITSGSFVTVDGASSLRQSTYNPDYSTITLSNSLLYNVGNTTGVTLQNSATPPFNPFATAAAGAHYLNLQDPTVRSWFESRPTSLQPPAADLAAELARTSVMAPVPLPSTLNFNMTLSGAAIDSTGASPAVRIGYHYWPIHYLCQGSTLSNATLTLTNGVVLAATNNLMLTLGSGSKLISRGRPDAMNQLCWATAVQELPIGGAASGGRTLLAIFTGNAVWPEINWTFTRADVQAETMTSRRCLVDMSGTGRNLAQLVLRDCQFSGAWIQFSPTDYGAQQFDLRNCVFENCRVEAYKHYNGQPTVSIRNCLFSGGIVILYHYLVDSSVPPWTLTDNVFLGVNLSAYSTSTDRLYAGWNGYSGSSIFFGGISNKVSLQSDWVSGPLGRWYYPTTGGSTSLASLVNLGSQTALNAGLYHYTTRADQTREGASWLDIGFHYPAATGTALADTDGDGLPDLVEDGDFNGAVGSNETDWNNADSDGDGALDGEEVAAGTDPKSKLSWIPKRLAAWWWDNAGGTWRNGDRGQEPIQTGPETAVAGVIGNGVDLYPGSPPITPLRYRINEASGYPNLRLDQGSIRLWFKPDWVLPSQTSAWGPLVDIGEKANNSLLWWSWYFRFDSNGDSWLRLAQANNDLYWTKLNVGQWNTSPTWHELAMSYCGEFTRLYHDGSIHTWNDPTKTPPLQSGGPGIITGSLPTQQGVSEGFRLGVNRAGSSQVDGRIDCIETFNYPVEEVDNYRNQQLTINVVTNAGVQKLQFTRNFQGFPRPAPVVVAKRDPWRLTLWRRSAGASSWGVDPIVSDNTDEVWVDPSAVSGQAYEYKARLQLGTGATMHYRHLIGGFGIPPQHQRGTVLLLVDESLAPQLTLELNQLKSSLVGDGWLVKINNAPRHNDTSFAANRPNLTNIVTWIANNYTPDTTNVIFIIGHVTIPYSGTLAADAHSDHTGAWVCDGYYGFTNKVPWTDANNDGKFDLDYLPGIPDFAVGRVDFSNLPVFAGLSETDLIKRYLQKDFRFRSAETPTFNRVLACFQNDRVDSGIDGAQTFSGAFGVTPGTLAAVNSLASKVPADLSVHFSSGFDNSVWDIGFSDLFSAANFADTAKEVPVTFRNVWFSYACDWARISSIDGSIVQNNWLRASLGWPNHGLATMGGYRWDFGWVAGGAPLAETMRRGLWAESGQVPRFQSILGDPTLRLFRVAPPGLLHVSRVGATATLSWTPSSEPGCVYYVYRSTNGIDGFSTPLNPNDPVQGLTFTDTGSAAGYLYQVRACRLQVTGAGSFWNTSQGTFGVTP